MLRIAFSMFVQRQKELTRGSNMFDSIAYIDGTKLCKMNLCKFMLVCISCC